MPLHTLVVAAFALAISLTNLVLAFLVWNRNRHNKINISLAFFALCTGLWIFTNFLLRLTTNYYLLRLTFSLGALVVVAAIIWVEFFKGKINLFDKITIAVVSFFGLIFAILPFAGDAIVKGVLLSTDPFASFQQGSFFNYYATFTALAAIIPLVLLLRTYRDTNGARKNQYKFIIFGLALFSFFTILVDILLPFVGIEKFSSLDSFFSLFFVGFASYAIVKYRLLDIRFVVAKSLGYFVLLITLAALYAGSVLGLERIFLAGQASSFNLIQTIIQTSIAVVMVFLFQPLRQWVTNATDKIFFKNSYDKDDLLSELSNTLGSTIVLIEMLYKVSDILTREMKASRTLFALIKDDNRLYTVQANGYKETPDVDPRDILHITKDGLMIADELEDNSTHKRLLHQYDAAIAIPLRTEKEVVGVLLLGEKSSGDMYNQQDLSVLEIVAPEIAVAIENAKSYEEINRFNITLRQEVKRATYRLKEKNTQLMELDKAKDEFISMASHQLRTPLTAIKGYLSMLLEGDAGDIKVSQYDFINEAYSGANRMVGLINDLLNVSRMETGRFFLEPKEVDIERVVEEEVKQLTNAAKTKGLYLKIERKGKVPHIWADETKIRQVVMNFMDNAIYYTNNGGVTVVLSHDKDNFIYEVKDTGIGVPKAQQEHMFEKFFRADNARTARPDGTGLGIYLAKRVVSDHGGEIIFNSEEGKGSTFGFKFPLKHKIETKPVSSPAPQATVTTPTMTDAVNTAEKSTKE